MLHKREKNSWEPYRICLLNSSANPAQFGWKWAGLAVLATPMTFFIFSAQYFFKNYLTKHFCPHIFDTYYFSYRWCVSSAYNLLYFTLCLELIIVIRYPRAFTMHFEIPVMYTLENANKKLNLRLYTLSCLCVQHFLLD